MPSYFNRSDINSSEIQNSRRPDRWSSLAPKLKHILHCAVMLGIIGLSIDKNIRMKNCVLSKFDKLIDDSDPFEAYGTYYTVLLYIPRLLVLLALPLFVFNFCGLFFFNCFNNQVILKYSPSQAPFICFRVVTKGYYPNLVRKIVLKNLEVCLQEKLEKFLIEVIAEESIEGLLQHPKVRQIVVPSDYRTERSSLFKARVLQYGLENGTHLLKNDDYIVHLDEETLLSKNSIRGILNFTTDGKHPIGQGLITFTNGDVINWITTLLDTFRVTDDLGKMRFQFRVFHKPFFGLRGSYMVIKSKVEHDVSFDHGPDGSVAEDTFFAMIAFKKGYSFDFIEGEMHEKSPFTLTDLLRQRKRWTQGAILVAHSLEIPLKNKFLFGMTLYSQLLAPLAGSGVVLSTLYPLLNNRLIGLNVLSAFIGGTVIYALFFGWLKSYDLKDINMWQFLLGVIGILCLLPLNFIIGIVHVPQSVFGEKHNFHIVQK
ncbi:beta-1,4-mannosyltransferase egh-like [Brevipalpus obovatus]|uniref:beta-1,4-mannosyltransferase egh-like n=1 Tax=Brevipalpus obovatus TaxID=246614 RepID=UPI003D9EA233